MIRNLSLTFAEFREANVARCEDVFHQLNSWTPNDWMVALVGEVGEAANILKKIKRLEGAGNQDTKTLDELMVEFRKELADIQTYLDLLAASTDTDLAKETILKFNEVSDKRGSKIKL